MNYNMITGSQVEAYFLVTPETGEISSVSIGPRRKRRPMGFIKPGTRGSGGGYRMLSIPIGPRKSAKVRAHHLVWMWVHGEWPKGEIDHINGDRGDNRISNLRLVTVSQNRTNKARQSNNKSGFKWVYWHKQRNLWCAEITAPESMGVGRKRLHCTFHQTSEEAHEAACKAAKRLHGEFFNPGYTS